MPSLPAPHFDLRHTLESGQCFRWQRDGDGYLCQERDRTWHVRQDGDTLAYRGAPKAFVKRFFALDEDFDAILETLGEDEHLLAPLAACRGLRILRQDPWECTVAFLCSQMSNVKKIRLNMDRIARAFGKQSEFEGRPVHTFPAPGAIDDESKLKKCAVGFRAKYILAANDALTDATLAKLKRQPCAKAKDALLEIPGIGEKVADCILLFGLGKGEAFPVDVWMERALRETHFKGTRLPLKHLAAYGRERWGALAGYAQQYIYHYWRTQHGKTLAR